ncbi:hypothetical protein Gohar_003501 [Gossypium harknessii]|uniref:Uncharacterized protein n=1 Tax=Gossypium harknessii TaxID=34285 RepID=A0A7J9HPH7_9ROSI|nr:hypothetical protein [Gossypium harknessii]
MGWLLYGGRVVKPSSLRSMVKKRGEASSFSQEQLELSIVSNLSLVILGSNGSRALSTEYRAPNFELSSSLTVLELGSTRLHPFLQEDEFSVEGPRTPFLGPHKIFLEKLQALPFFTVLLITLGFMALYPSRSGIYNLIELSESSNVNSNIMQINLYEVSGVNVISRVTIYLNLRCTMLLQYLPWIGALKKEGKKRVKVSWRLLY